MLRKRAVAVALTALLSPTVFGLGLGTLTTKSALNEPFNARIEILGATAQDFDALQVKLADAAQFERAHVSRDAVLLGLRFEAVSSDTGPDFVRITTKDPVREPFLNFLLELNWANGRMIREYTVLLDPPLYDRNRRAVIAPMASAPRPLSEAPVTAASTQNPVMPAAASPASTIAPAGDLGPVQANDTAWSLANAHRPDSVSVQQMMLALLRANPRAFGNNNVNVLKRGAVLHMPSSADLASLSQHDAIQEMQRQHQLWQEYRQGVSRTPATAAESAPQPTPRSTATTETSESGVKESASHLELAAPKADDGTVKPPVAGAAASTGHELATESLDTKTQENTDLQAKLAEADQIIDLLQRQVKVKDDELAALQARLGTPGAGATATTPAPEITTATPTPPPTPEPPPAVVPTTPAPTPVVAAEAPPASVGGPLEAIGGFIPEHIRNAVPGGLLTILGIAGSLLLLLAIGIGKALLGGRGDKPLGDTAATTRIPAGVAHAPLPAADDLLMTQDDLTVADTLGAATMGADDEKFQRTLEASTEQLHARPQEDPLEEVNVYLAYERFDQAEELVKKAIADHPGEHKYKLRLLEIYYSANNKRSYEAAARELHDAVGDASPLWENALAMWSEMSPERALFAPGSAVDTASDSGTASKTFVDITSAASGAAVALAGDSLLAATQVGLTNEPRAESAPSLDFDLGDTGSPSELPGPVLDVTAGELEVGDDVIDLTATSTDVGHGGVLDLTATMDRTQDVAAGDVFDISSHGKTASDTLELGDATSIHTLDLLDVTKTAHGAFDTPQDLLDVTTPRRGIERTESPTVNALSDDANVEFDISDTVAPAMGPIDVGPTLTAADDDLSLDFNIDGLALSAAAPGADADAGHEIPEYDLTIESESPLDGEQAAQADLSLSLQNPALANMDFADDAALAGGSESDIEFDLALQDTTDFESLAIDDTLELPKSHAARSGMLPVEGVNESLEDLTRSMEASIAGLDLDDDKHDDSILDLALEPMDSEGIDLDFGLDDGSGFNEMDTLALDRTELGFGERGGVERAVAMPRDRDLEYQSASDETDTKLNLAKAYIELGDNDGARTILDEVVADGTDSQRDEARKLLTQIS
ncbi:MAG: hypothetical protein HYX63_09705 [Gammaproteobacteria bacterium]|nr:hypothetical protein [Gammaproteobacteria bacterium]